MTFAEFEKRYTKWVLLEQLKTPAQLPLCVRAIEYNHALFQLSTTVNGKPAYDSSDPRTITQLSMPDAWREQWLRYAIKCLDR